MSKVQKLEDQLSIEVKLHEFVCEFIIDADENEDQFDLKFLIDTVLSQLVIVDQYKAGQLQYQTKIKQNIQKLVTIALSTIGTETYLEALTSDEQEY